MSQGSDPRAELAREAAKSGGSIVGELISFLKQNKKWWLGPIIVVLLLAAALVILGGSAIAPFIYTVF
ncbi:MAG TPA: DUF5989 family protein [Thermoanaerobaculia bacterium]|nr:DUF5989 family protein [Thermoanaerobaculia bacterium]